MSRRTRLKPYPKERFSINHHFSYGESTSHFPKSYSAVGKDIKFPTSVVPLQMGEKFIFVGNIDEYFETMKTADVKMEQIKLASVSISGDKFQEGSTCINFGLFAVSIACFFVSYLSNLDRYRNRWYPKYRFQDYEGITQIIEQFSHVDTLIINIQDNQINIEKTRVIERALLKSNIKKCIVRNLSYYIEVENEGEFFGEIRAKRDREFAFVWEKLVLDSHKNQQNNEEGRLMNEEVC